MEYFINSQGITQCDKNIKSTLIRKRALMQKACRETIQEPVLILIQVSQNRDIVLSAISMHVWPTVHKQNPCREQHMQEMILLLCSHSIHLYKMFLSYATIYFWKQSKLEASISCSRHLRNFQVDYSSLPLFHPISLGILI